MRIPFLALLGALLLAATAGLAQEKSIFRAAYDGDVATLRALIAKDPNVVRQADPQRGGTPLHWAAAGDQVDAATALSDAGANLDALDAQGRTPLIWAASYGKPAAAKWLVVHGADLAVRDRAGKTAFVYAQTSGATDLMRLLDGTALRARMVVDIPPAAPLRCCCYSPDGALAAAIGEDRHIYIWDTVSGRLLRRMYNGNERIESAQFSVDGRSILTLLASGGMAKWDVVIGWPIGGGVVPEGEVTGAHAFGVSSAEQVCWDGSRQRISLWRKDGPRPTITTFDALTGSTRCIALSPDGRYLATGGEDKTFKLWEMATRRLIATIGDLPDGVTSLAFSPDSTTLAVCAGRQGVQLYDTATGKPGAELVAHASIAVEALFTDGGRSLAIAGADSRLALAPKASVKVVDVATGAVVRACPYDRSAVPTRMAISPDGRHAVAQGDMAVIALDLVSGTVRQWATIVDVSAIHQLSLALGGKELLARRDGGFVRWDLGTGACESVALAGIRAHSTDGRMAVCVRMGAGGHEMHIVETAKGQDVAPAAQLASDLLYASFTSDGARVVTLNGNSQLQVWDATTCAPLWAAAIVRQAAERPVLSSDGSIVVTQGDGETLDVRDVATGRLLRKIDIPDASVQSLIFGSDGSALIVLGSGSAHTHLVQMATGATRLLAKVRGMYGTLSRDGRLLAVADDRAVHLWDVSAVPPVLKRPFSAGVVHTLVFSDDGHRLFAGAHDGTISVWDTRTGLELAICFADRAGGWVATAPGRRYDASPEGEKLVGWVDGLKPVANDAALRARARTPGLLPRVLRDGTLPSP